MCKSKSTSFTPQHQYNFRSQTPTKRRSMRLLQILALLVFHLWCNTTSHEAIPSNKSISEAICPPIETSISEEVICKLNDHIANCSDPTENMSARIRCQQFYISNERPQLYRCHNGEWDETFSPCSPACGMTNPGFSFPNGSVSAHIYPWIVAIYNATENFICGGTIISVDYVLSAAHCFTNNAGEVKSKDDYTIIAGKHHKDVTTNDPDSQLRKIESLFVHEDFGGSYKNYHHDIALLRLIKHFKLSTNVQPVCIDWDNIYEDFDFRDQNKGIVLSWGYKRLGEALSNDLKQITVSYIPRQVCLHHLPLDFGLDYFSPDKICGEYTNNNTVVCQGASGSGLFFLSDNKKMYIRGIVSVAVKFSGLCNANKYTLYTAVSRYLPWIANITKIAL